MNPTQFEEFVADLLRYRGYRDVRRVGKAGDLGVDVEARNAEDRLVAVQCKRYQPTSSISSSDMQQFFGMMVHHGAAWGIFVTTCRFTRAAKDLAAQRDIELIDGNQLVEYLEELRPTLDTSPVSSQRQLVAPANRSSNDGPTFLETLFWFSVRLIADVALGYGRWLFSIFREFPRRARAAPYRFVLGISLRILSVWIPVSVAASAFDTDNEPAGATRLNASTATATRSPTSTSATLPPATSTVAVTVLIAESANTRTTEIALNSRATAEAPSHTTTGSQSDDSASGAGVTLVANASPIRTPNPANPPTSTATTMASTATPRPIATGTEPPTATLIPRPTRTPTPGPTIPPGIPQNVTAATVVEIIDGDTLEVSVGEQTQIVHLIGVDAPEQRSSGDQAECFGLEAKQRVEKTVPVGTIVYLETDTVDRDEVSSLLRYLWYVREENGRPYMLNERLLAEGYAILESQPINDRYVERFVRMQEFARDQNRGLWSVCDSLDEQLVPLAPTSDIQ